IARETKLIADEAAKAIGESAETVGKPAQAVGRAERRLIGVKPRLAVEAGLVGVDVSLRIVRAGRSCRNRRLRRNYRLSGRDVRRLDHGRVGVVRIVRVEIRILR